MGSAEIDRLEVVIEAEASNANKQLDKLATNLDRIASKLGKVNVSGIKSVGTASKDSGNSLKKLSSSMDILSSKANKTSRSFSSFAEAAGKFYANCFLIIRGIKKIGSAIETSMDYVETFNYWNVTMDKIGTEFGNKFEQYGYESAETYAESFTSRMKDLTTKMTGYSVGDSGELTSSGSIGLALDPEQLMNYQSSVMAVTNSLGLAGETSVNTAKALSMLSADMSSFKNVDLSTVMTNFQSGLIGQSRALYKYGIDITNATLQNYAYENGVTKSISAMTQAEKMQLRLIAILDQSKVAWGDQANTISSVANQYRILKQQISNLARVIGNLFLPIVQKVLPVVNGLIVALQRLFTTLGFKLFGDDWLSGIMDGISSGYSDDSLDGLADSADDTADALESANEAAKALKTTTLGIDELNVNSPSSDSGSTSSSGSGSSDGIDLSGAISSALADYESIWDKALADSENKAQGYADTISSMFTNMWTAIEPFRNSISNLWDNGLSKLAGFTWTALGDFYDNFLVPIGTWAFGTEDSGFTRLVNIINDSLMAIDWDKLNSSLSAFWTAIGPYAEQFGEGLIDFVEDVRGLDVAIMNSLPGFLDGITSALNNGDPENARNWGYSLGVFAVGLMALKPAIALASGISTVVGVISTILSGGWLEGAGVFATIGNAISMIINGAGTVEEVLTVMFTPLQGIIAAVGGAVLAIANFFIMMKEGFSWLNEALMVIGIALATVGAIILGVAAFPAVVVAAIVAAAATIAVVIHDNWDAICDWFSGAAEWFNTNVISPICEFFKGLWEDVSGFFGSLWSDICSVWSTVSTWFSEKVITPIVNFFVGFWTRVSQIFKGLWIIVQAVWIVASSWFNNNVINPVVGFFKKLWSDVSGFFTKLWSDIQTVWSVVSGWFNTNIITPVINLFKTIWTNVSAFFSQLWSDIKGVWNNVYSWFDRNIISPLRTAFDTVTGAISTAFSNAWEAIKRGVVGSMNFVIKGIESAINWIVNGINGILGGFNKVVTVAAKIVGADWSGVDPVPTVSLSRISMYAEGGMPNTGEMFIARENGLNEMVGRIGNKSTVANNDQIVAGISSGVAQANSEQNALLREQNRLLRQLLDKDFDVNITDRQIARAAIKGQKQIGMQLRTT